MNVKAPLLFISFLIGSVGIASPKTTKMKTIEITKKVHINKDITTVFSMVKYLKHFPKWSPFLEEDPTQQYEVKGNDGKVGAQYHWEGNKGKDLGYQEIIEILENKCIKMQCQIQKPFLAQPIFNYHFQPDSKGVWVTQHFILPVKPMDSFFMSLFGVKKKMAKTNERGLELLKKAAENQQ